MSPSRLGIWAVGAKGAIATTLASGLAAFQSAGLENTGLVTEGPDFRHLDLSPLEQCELGGCDLRSTPFIEAAQDMLLELGLCTPQLWQAIQPRLLEFAEAIQTGTACNCGPAIESLNDQPFTDRSLLEEIEIIRSQLNDFKQTKQLDLVVVVNLASTEPFLALTEKHASSQGIEEVLRSDARSCVRASTLYAYAAIQEGCPYINFTPSNGALLPGMIQLAREKGVPVMGNDGKTGETLVKSALAPMFRSRNLTVLTWQGFNILGNSDGRILDHDGNKEPKIHSKDGVLSGILGYSPLSGVRIDYVPSLGDQKTAWDFIHFQGFLGSKMTLQFIWQGLDSILAAPLVLDLARLMELAHRCGESGPMPHLSFFFKSPLECGEHNLHRQHDMLAEYLRKHPAPGTGKNE